MQFTTRCTACGTLFWVVNDQLKVSDGWVRCGYCGEVFDAMLDLEVAAHTLTTDDPSSFNVVPVPVTVQATGPGETSAASLSPAEPGVLAASSAVADDQRPVSALSADAVQAREAMGHEEIPVAPRDTSAVRSGQLEPGFVRQARRRAFWRSPGVRAFMVLLCLVLSMLLAGQWALHQRDRLAASQPAMAPWLGKACEWLGCQLKPVQRLEAIVIDSTTLVHRLDNFYAFDIVLKNTASIPLAMPALELTLTKPDEAVMARRVFLPEDLPDAPDLLPAHASVALSLRLSLVAGEVAPMAGYRALIFYP